MKINIVILTVCATGRYYIIYLSYIYVVWTFGQQLIKKIISFTLSQDLTSESNF